MHQDDEDYCDLPQWPSFSSFVIAGHVTNVNELETEIPFMIYARFFFVFWVKITQTTVVPINIESIDTNRKNRVPFLFYLLLSARAIFL